MSGLGSHRERRRSPALAMALQANTSKLRHAAAERLGADTFDSYLTELEVVEASTDRVVLRIGPTLAREASHPLRPSARQRLPAAVRLSPGAAGRRRRVLRAWRQHRAAVRRGSPASWRSAVELVVGDGECVSARGLVGSLGSTGDWRSRRRSGCRSRSRRACRRGEPGVSPPQPGRAASVRRPVGPSVQRAYADGVSHVVDTRKPHARLGPVLAAGPVFAARPSRQRPSPERRTPANPPGDGQGNTGAVKRIRSAVRQRHHLQSSDCAKPTRTAPTPTRNSPPTPGGGGVSGLLGESR
jgi:hypothetical protein